MATTSMMRTTGSKALFLVLGFLSCGFVGIRPLWADSLPDDSGELSKLLRVGAVWSHPDGGLTVTFAGVTQDNRLTSKPRPVRRRSDRKVRRNRGNAEVSLVLEAGNQAPKAVFLNTRREPSHEVIPANQYPPGVSGIPKSYIITIRKLLPSASKQGKPRAQGAYLLRLQVDVAL